MVLLHLDVRSHVLGADAPITVCLPDHGDALAPPPSARPVLYLLHGLGDDHLAWSRNTSVEEYAASRGLAVVMPDVGRGWYTDGRDGPRRWTYLSEELPEIVDALVPVSSAPEDTFVAGISMGGYGAVKWAMRHPERFAMAASISGALDIAALRRDADHEFAYMRADLVRAFGEHDLAGTEHDLLHLLELGRWGALPLLHIACGTEDERVGDSRTFVRHALGTGLEVTSAFNEGDHDWDYWNVAIRDVIDRLPLRGSPGPDE